MNVTGIVYLSESKVEFDREELLALVKHAREKNKSLGITGYLCEFRGRFIQYIEGPEAELNELYETIRNDDRHRVMHYEMSEGLSSRRFPTWSMRMINKEELKRYNIEIVLENNLLYLKNGFPSPEKITNNVWQLVNTISKIHG